MARFELTKQEEQTLLILEKLHKNWMPHQGQLELLKPLFNGEVDVMMGQNGRKNGKDLALTEPVLTPKGFVPIGDLNVGDDIISGLGKETKVTYISPTYTKNKCYIVKFNDGTKIVAGEDHKWEVGNKHGNWKNLLTKELTPRWFRTKLPKVEGRRKEFILEPYLLGAWLGDGCKRGGKFSTEDKALLNAFSKQFEIGSFDNRCTYCIKGLRKVIRELNLFCNKHIPDDYMYAAFEQRLELFKGLMDTDGHVSPKGTVEFVQKRKLLFEQTVQLGRSLGLRIHVLKPKEIKGVEYHRFICSANLQVFNLERKAKVLAPFIGGVRRKYKNIISVTPTETVETRCISVACESHTFITRNYTVTHNTDSSCYFLWRHALLYPNSHVYYIAPEFAHARELLWNNQRIQKFGPQEFIERINNNESRIYFKNGSFIKLLGSENYAAANGLTPSAVVYDEYKAFHPRWHNEFDPNRAAKDAPLLIIGTPPRPGDRNKAGYEEMVEICKSTIRHGHVRQTSYANPYIKKDWLDAKKAQLFKRGDMDIWYREYEAKIVAGGRNSIYPMFDPEKHVKPHAEILKEIKRDKRKLEWFCVADPGTTTCFATLFGAINPYTKKVYILDEIYEKDQYQTSVRQLYPRMDAKMAELFPEGDVIEDWTKCYDEAAAWFANETQAQYGVYFFPTNKQLNKKEQGISLCKDQLVHELVVISDKCTNLVYEIENYVRDDSGKIPKINDHLLDCWRYLNGAANYNMVEALEIIKDKNDRARRFYKVADETIELKKERDWTYKFEDDWLD